MARSGIKVQLGISKTLIELSNLSNISNLSNLGFKTAGPSDDGWPVAGADADWQLTNPRLVTWHTMVTPSLQSPDSGSGSISISNSATLPLPPPTAATTPNSMLSVRAMCNDVSKPCPDVDDEDMRAAAEALHGLRSSTHSLHPQGHSQGHSQPYSNEEWASTNFMARVQHLHLPLVASTVRAMANVAGMYESSKESSAIVRTSARAVEDKVKLVVGRLEPTVGSLAAGLDRFACSQLDKVPLPVHLLRRPPCLSHTTPHLSGPRSHSPITHSTPH